MKNIRISSYSIVLILTFYLFPVAATSGELIQPMEDPHYTDIGFFDIHVCNWPNRPLFFLSIFSTTSFDKIKKIEIQGINGELIGELNLEKYRLLYLEDKNNKKKKIEKRVFMANQEIPAGSKNGWYQTVITTTDNKQYLAKDYVVLHEMQRATGVNPAPGVEDVPLMKELTWDPIPGAKHYKVFVWDKWEEKLIIESAVLNEAKLTLPKNLLQAGGLYAWRIHARDVNENILLGDFNHGSLTEKMTFSIAE